MTFDQSQRMGRRLQEAEAQANRTTRHSAGAAYYLRGAISIGLYAHGLMPLYFFPVPCRRYRHEPDMNCRVLNYAVSDWNV